MNTDTNSASNAHAAANPTGQMRLNRRSLDDAFDVHQHDHEQKQHHDSARVNDDLHAGNERGIQHQVESRHRKQGHDQRERGMHRVPPRDDRHAAGDGQSRQHIKEPRRRDRGHACIDSGVQRRVHETITPTMAVNISTPSEIGSITFHPILINWSKR